MRPAAREYQHRATRVSTIPELAVVALTVWIFVIHKKHLVLGTCELDLDSGFASPRLNVPRNKVALCTTLEPLARASPELRKIEIEKFSFEEKANDELATQPAPEHDRSATADIQTGRRE